jgi:hypothetical protein
MNKQEQKNAIKENKGTSTMDKRSIIVFSAIIALMIAALLSLLASAVRMTIQSSSGDVITTYGPVYSFIFGGKVVSEHTSYVYKGVNGLLLSGWILIVLGFIGTISAFVCMLMGKLKEETRTAIFFISSILVMVAAILMFSSKYQLAESLCMIITGTKSPSVVNTIDSNLSLRFGVWGSGVFALFSSLALIVVLFQRGMLTKLYETVLSNIKASFKNN